MDTKHEYINEGELFDELLKKEPIVIDNKKTPDPLLFDMLKKDGFKVGEIGHLNIPPLGIGSGKSNMTLNLLMLAKRQGKKVKLVTVGDFIDRPMVKR